MLDKINLDLGNAIQVNQWKNTNNAISWFKNMKSKNA